MKRIQGVVVITALSLLFVAAGCGGSSSSSSSSDESEGTTSTTIMGSQVESHGTKDVSTASGKVEIELYDNYFEPTILKGKPGQMVELELKNEGNATHSFKLADQSVDKVIQPGDETETDVKFPASGELKFVCKFHGAEGMIGALQSSAASSTSTTTSSSKY
jgi:plastocyanin